MTQLFGTQTLSVDLTTLHHRHLEAYCQIVNKSMTEVLEDFIEALKLPPTVDPDARKSFISIEQRALLCFREVQAQAGTASAQGAAQKKQETAQKREVAKQQEAQALDLLQSMGQSQGLSVPTTVAVGHLYLMALGGSLRLVKVVELPSGKVIFKTSDDGRQQPKRNPSNFLPYVRGPVAPAQVPSLTQAIQGGGVPVASPPAPPMLTNEQVESILSEMVSPPAPATPSVPAKAESKTPSNRLSSSQIEI